MENKNQTKDIIEPQHIHCLKVEFFIPATSLKSNRNERQQSTTYQTGFIYYTKCRLEGALLVWEQNTVNPVNMDTKRVIEYIYISVLTGCPY